ncbi:MAG: histidinol-phosphate aminotransferase family protein [Anaerolineae bacterium]|jgi:histidinol-phosphate aminotransferase|nr:histidinol-phosphate aminotransferase family protein [Anaerolineae bacterium]MBT7188841.1 histidinol-phosphate aminotransferase family protein [Anaerolineae bacterium]MBT7989882.1 histidinol-phosphate aminotransferase family protein [Anaerolineae bacterium]
MTKEVQEYFVPWVKGISMYVSEHIELAWRQPELHRMMSNENPFEPSEKVMKAIQNFGKKANRYPDQGLVVRSKIAEINRLDGPGNVIIGNGSSEVFDNIFRSFLEVGDEVIQHTPCFGIYKLRCNILGGKLVSVPMLYADEKLNFDVDAILAAITDKTKIIVVANPNNPSGNFMPKDDFIKIAETGIPFIVDEAYIEFAGLGKSHVDLVKKYKNVLITRTLSKAYGLAGMRFGYALGDEAVIAQISAALLPWNVGTIPMWAALAALEDVEGLKMRVEFNNSEVEYIESSLSVIPGFTVFHSASNYILFDGTGTGKKGDDLVAYAQEKGIILRPQSEMYGFDGWFRLTLGSKEENRMAVETILEFYA